MNPILSKILQAALLAAVTAIATRIHDHFDQEREPKIGSD